MRAPVLLEASRSQEIKEERMNTKILSMAARAAILAIALSLLTVGAAERAAAHEGNTSVKIYQTPTHVHIVVSDPDGLDSVYARVLNPNTGQIEWSKIVYPDCAKSVEITLTAAEWAALNPNFTLKVTASDNEHNPAMSIWTWPVSRALPDWQNPADMDKQSEVVIQGVAMTKSLWDGCYTELQGEPVTAGTDQMGGDFYIEELNRFGGIRVRPLLSGTIPAGTTVNVVGKLATLESGERMVAEAVVTPAPDVPDPLPLAMPNRILGGGDFFYEPGPANVGQQGVEGGYGLNSIGLYVRVWGRVIQVDSLPAHAWFVIEDGSGVGLKVLAEYGTGSLLVGNEYVVVTGVSSCEVNPLHERPKRLLIATEWSVISE